MKGILLAYGRFKETVIVVMMFIKWTKTVVRPPDSDTDFFHVFVRPLNGDTLTSFLFIICLDYILYRIYTLIFKMPVIPLIPETKVVDVSKLISHGNLLVRKVT